MTSLWIVCDAVDDVGRAAFQTIRSTDESVCRKDDGKRTLFRNYHYRIIITFFTGYSPPRFPNGAIKT